MPLFELDLSTALSPYGQQIPTRCMLVAQGALQRTLETLRAHLPQGRWLLVADCHTWPLVATAIKGQFNPVGLDYAVHIFSTAPAPTLEAIGELQAQLTGSSAVVAIGAGTINDIAKMAAHGVGVPYAIIATAPSMNGYTSSVAALLEEGVKTTRPCAPPVAIIADIDLLAQAPYRMTAAGLGDLLSKPVSQADWLLAHYLTESPYSRQAAQLIDTSATLLDGVPPHLPSRQPEAIGRLMGSLLLSGLAMTLAGTSAPSSGGEHLISHYLDMTHYAFDAANDLHGCQVGVATIATAALYEKLLAFDPTSIDIDRRVETHIPWETYRGIIEKRFTTLCDAVLPHAEKNYPTAKELRQRLGHLKENWREITAPIAAVLHTAAQIRAHLEAAKAPTDFAALGVDPTRAHYAITHSKDIRARYTILHLLDELGVLETWSEQVLEEENLLSAR